MVIVINEGTTIGDISGFKQLSSKFKFAGKKVVAKFKGDYKAVSADAIRDQIKSIDKTIKNIDDEINEFATNGNKISPKVAAKNIFGYAIESTIASYLGLIPIVPVEIGGQFLARRAAASLSIDKLNTYGANINKKYVLSKTNIPNLRMSIKASFDAYVHWAAIGAAISTLLSTASVFIDYEETLQGWKETLQDQKKELEDKLKKAEAEAEKEKAKKEK